LNYIIKIYKNMLIIKNKEELAKLVSKDKDLIIDEDVKIEYQVKKGELRDVKCKNLYLENDNQRFNFIGGDFNGEDFNGEDFNGWDFNGRDFKGGNFKGRDFNGWDFNGRDFDGRDFNGWDFNGRDFNGRDFNGWDFNGEKVFYNAFFNCYGKMKCESYKARREVHAEPIALMGIEIIKPKASYSTDDAMKYKAVKEAIENASPDTIDLIHKMLNFRQ